MLIDGTGELPEVYRGFIRKFVLSLLATVLALCLAGIIYRPSIRQPNLVQGHVYRIITDQTVPTQVIEQFRESVNFYFPEYREDRDGFPITLKVLVGTSNAGYTDKTGQGGCRIILDPENAEYSATTPAHEFNHCLRHDPWRNRSELSYIYVENFPMPAELACRWLMHYAELSWTSLKRHLKDSADALARRWLI